LPISAFPYALLAKLPPPPPGDRNLGHVSKSKIGGAHCFAWTTCKSYSRITHTRHLVKVDYRSLTIKKIILTNVYEAPCPSLDIGSGTAVVAKLAGFPWEIDYCGNETQAYSRVEGRGIGPNFLGHIIEEGRRVGFLLEKVVGRHAEIKDLVPCRHVFARLHALGIACGDQNKYNFLVPLADKDPVCLIDFEGAKRCKDVQAMKGEMQELEHQLRSVSTAGAFYDVA
jgi:hypothetical protein